MAKLFRMKNIKKKKNKVFFFYLKKKKKEETFIDQTFAHHTSTPLAFLYKKKKLAKFSIPKPSVYRGKERFPNRISKVYE